MCCYSICIISPTIHSYYNAFIFIFQKLDFLFEIEHKLDMCSWIFFFFFSPCDAVKRKGLKSFIILCGLKKKRNWELAIKLQKSILFLKSWARVIVRVQEGATAHLFLVPRNTLNYETETSCLDLIKGWQLE